MANLEAELKALIVETFELEGMAASDIATEAPLFGDGLGLDSIDALELGVALKKKYPIQIDAESTDLLQAFYSVKNLASFVESQLRKHPLMKTQEEIFATLKQLMAEMFELAPEDIRLDARLGQDLDIDSIDAVDLMARLRELVGKRINPEDFKNARTVQDVVDTIHRITAA